MGDEKWKDVDGFEGLYQISNLGRVKSLGRYKEKTNHIERVNEKILSLGINHKGYCITYLYKNSKRKTFLVHRLVAEAFIPNPNHLPQVNHINGIKQDNRPQNLEWCTNEYNQKHAQENGLNPTKKVLLKNKKEEYTFNSIQDAYKFLNKTPSGHYKKYINTNQKHLNYFWEYL